MGSTLDSDPGSGRTKADLNWRVAGHARGRCAGPTGALLAAGTILQDCKIGRNRRRRLPPEGRGHRRCPSQPGHHCFSATRVCWLGWAYMKTGASRLRCI